MHAITLCTNTVIGEEGNLVYKGYMSKLFTTLSSTSLYIRCVSICSSDYIAIFLNSSSKTNITMQHQLPQGFRFRPTDQELVFDYLLKKVLGQPLPSNAVIEAEVYGCEAQIREAIDQSDGEKFLFVKRRMKNQEGTRMNRSANGVSWKVTGNKKHILDKSGKLIGIKRSLVFKGNYRYKRLLMDEYELAESIIPKNVVEWVVCRIKESNRSLESSLESDDMTSPADTMINLEDDWVNQDNSDFINECLTYIQSD